MTPAPPRSTAPARKTPRPSRKQTCLAATRRRDRHLRPAGDVRAVGQRGAGGRAALEEVGVRGGKRQRDSRMQARRQGWGRVRSSARRRAWAVGELRMRRRVWCRAVAMKLKPARSWTRASPAGSVGVRPRAVKEAMAGEAMAGEVGCEAP